MASNLMFVVDLIGSKAAAALPGGHRSIQSQCIDMRLYLNNLWSHLNYDRAVTIKPQNPQGDDVVYQFEAASPQELADFASATAIHAFCDGPAGTFFRYVIYSVESGKTYYPRIKVFGDLSKTEMGKQHHIAIERGVVSSLTDTDVIAWLQDVPHVETDLKLTGEPWTGAYVDLYCPVGVSRDYRPSPARKDADLAEKTYYRYRDEPAPLLESPELIHHLESRYGCTALSVGSKLFPVTVIWRNVEQLIDPEVILGNLDFTPPAPLISSPALSPSEYAEARAFIRAKYTSRGPKHEGCDYRMTRIESSDNLPKILGAFGLYYDNILTQYAIEWELKKALLTDAAGAIHTLSKPGTLPLRETIEAQGNPLINGNGRCAAITVSTLLVFKRPTGAFACLIRRRSLDVGVSPGMLHVVPAGMFEASNGNDNWSIRLNVWRELLEEVYNEEEQQGSEYAETLDHIQGKEPVQLIRQMLNEGSAEFSVTGIACDLLNLRPEVCTVLFVADSAFAEVRQMKLNWEYEPEHRTGTSLVGWDRIDDVIEKDGARYGIVPSGAACLALGREWVKRRHGM